MIVGHMSLKCIHTHLRESGNEGNRKQKMEMVITYGSIWLNALEQQRNPSHSTALVVL